MNVTIDYFSFQVSVLSCLQLGRSLRFLAPGSPTLILKLLDLRLTWPLLCSGLFYARVGAGLPREALCLTNRNRGPSPLLPV